MGIILTQSSNEDLPMQNTLAIITDSTYVLWGAAKDGHDQRANEDLWAMFRTVLDNLHEWDVMVKFLYCEGHSNVASNTENDKLAR
ncbi:hypothetical protein BC830DRAFT_1200321, partial [Chytriomyces sp. MP71]